MSVKVSIILSLICIGLILLFFGLVLPESNAGVELSVFDAIDIDSNGIPQFHSVDIPTTSTAVKND